MKALLIGVVFLLSIVPIAYAQEELKIQTVTLSPTPAPDIEYALPYPGILPDNPLYSIKAARDRIVSFFISDPLKKAEFDLLQADKRLQAGMFLLHKENPDVPLAISTISKGQNYFEEAVAAGVTVKKNKKLITDLPDRLHTAALKHQELLKKEAQELKGQEKKDFELLIKRVNRFVSLTEKMQKKTER